jgi:hypothetical protein
MNKYQSLCWAFQNAPGAIYAPTPAAPTILPGRYVPLWYRLISEELYEYLDAVKQGDVVSVCHEQADLLYVLYGLAVWQGVTIPGYALSTPFYQYHPDGAASDIEKHVKLVLNGIGVAPHYSLLTLIPAIGMLHTNPPEGVRLWPVFCEVHAANMRKMQGGIIRSEGGKILKPEGWQPADVAGVLRQQGISV